MIVYIVGLVVFLAAAAIALEFSFWLACEVSIEPRNHAKTQAEQDAWNEAYLSLVAPRPYDWNRG